LLGWQGEEKKMNDRKKQEAATVAAVTHDAARELERKLRLHPEDQDAKVDVGSEESMDASDPTVAAQPGQKDEPVPSSGFPE
jgi:hypothetical protein